MREFIGKCALITGASSGIGAGFAEELHRRGASVILVARRREALESLAARLNSVRAGSAEAIEADLTASAIDRVVARIGAGDVDLLVNNAGSGSFGEFAELDLERELGMVALNISASLRLAHAAIPAMKRRGSGAIISISSVAGHAPLPYMATYAATKAFNYWHSIALWYELKPHGITVLTVCPGPVDTEFAGVARIPGQWTGVARDSVKTVVNDSLAALAGRRPLVVPGARAPLLWAALSVLPRRLSVSIVGRELRKVLAMANQGGV